MGISAVKQQVIDGLMPGDRSRVFKHFNQLGSDINRFVSFVPSPAGAACWNRIEIIVDAEYTTVASDTSDLEDVISFIGTLAHSANLSPPLIPGAIINGLHDAYQTLEGIIEDEDKHGDELRLKFPLTVCDTDFEVIATTLRVRARGKVSNAAKEGYDPSSLDAAFAKATLTVNVGNDPLTEDRVISAVDAHQGNIREYALVNYSLVSGTQTVVASVAPHCRVPSAFTLFDEIAAHTVLRVDLIIEVVPAKLYSRMPATFQKFLQSKGITIPPGP